MRGCLGNSGTWQSEPQRRLISARWAARLLAAVYADGDGAGCGVIGGADMTGCGDPIGVLIGLIVGWGVAGAFFFLFLFFFFLQPFGFDLHGLGVAGGCIIPVAIGSGGIVCPNAIPVATKAVSAKRQSVRGSFNM